MKHLDEPDTTEPVTEEPSPPPRRCPVARPSRWARDGKTMQCEKPAGHDGRHEALAGFIMFPWDSEPPNLAVVGGTDLEKKGSAT